MGDKEESALRLPIIIAILLLAGSYQSYGSFINSESPQPSSKTVCPNGCDYSDLQMAVDAASPGDELHVISGTYDRVVLT
jgi:hypothetical protein